jgi:hypothetical protein
MSSGECALPWEDECSNDSFVCYNNAMCYAQYPSLGTSTYCNPGNERCMMKIGPGCAADF